MAVGNTFSATALSSYGGFWIAYGLLLTPTWNVLGEDGPYAGDTGSVMGFFLTGWFIFTTLLVICTLRSTVAFFLLFFTLDICFLLLACENYAHDLGNETARLALQKAAGLFGFLAAFMAWYNALAGIQDSRFVSPLAPAAMPGRKEKSTWNPPANMLSHSNSFFQVPVFHFPWSDKGQEQRKQKTERNLA